jgi:hypothetical protein
MNEDVNVKIIKNIKDGSYEENIKEFLLWAIREEFQRQSGKWAYKDEYDYYIKKFSKKETK